MSIKLGDKMAAYIGTENESEVGEINFPSPKDKNKEFIQDLVDDPTKSDEDQPRQNGSQVIEQENSSNGLFPKKNGFQIRSEEISDKSSTIPSDRKVTDPELLKHNGSHVLDQMNISNSDSNKNGLHILSGKIASPEKDVKNGLDAHGETNVAEELSNNSEDVKEDKIQIVKPVDILTEEHVKSSNGGSLGSTLSIFSPKSKLNESVKKQDAVTENTDQRKDELKSNSEVLDLETKATGSDKEHLSKGDEYVASEGILTKQDLEPRIQFKEQVLQCLNSSEMQLKFKEINNLIEHMKVNTFKQPVSANGDKMKPDSREDGPGIKAEDDLMHLPKRKSKQSDFEDPEELQLLAKKLKMSKNVDNTLENQIKEESESYTPEQFRFDYAEFFQRVPSEQSNKFNFAENNECSKVKAKLAELDGIAGRVLSAMSSDQYLEENDIDGIAKFRGIRTENKFAGRFAPDGYDYERVNMDLYPLVCISPEENQTLRESRSKTGVIACSRTPSDRGAKKSSTCRKRLEIEDKFVCKLTGLFELIKTLTLLGCFFPFLVFTYVIAKLLKLCFTSEKSSKDSKTSSGQQKMKDKSHK